MTHTWIFVPPHESSISCTPSALPALTSLCYCLKCGDGHHRNCALVPEITATHSGCDAARNCRLRLEGRSCWPPAPTRVPLIQTLCNCQVHVNHLSLAHILNGNHRTLTSSHTFLYRRVPAVFTCSLGRPWNFHGASTKLRVSPGLKEDDNSLWQEGYQSQVNTHNVHRINKNAIVAHNPLKQLRLADFRTTKNRQLDRSRLNTIAKRPHQQVISIPYIHISALETHIILCSWRQECRLICKLGRAKTFR